MTGNSYQIMSSMIVEINVLSVFDEMLVKKGMVDVTSSWRLLQSPGHKYVATELTFCKRLQLDNKNTSYTCTVLEILAKNCRIHLSKLTNNHTVITSYNVHWCMQQLWQTLLVFTDTESVGSITNRRQSIGRREKLCIVGLDSATEDLRWLSTMCLSECRLQAVSGMCQPSLCV